MNLKNTDCDDINDDRVQGNSSTYKEVDENSLRQDENGFETFKDFKKESNLIIEEDYENDNANGNHNIQDEHSSFLKKTALTPTKINSGFVKTEMLCTETKLLSRQIRIACCLYVGSLYFGYNVGWPASVAGKLQNPAETPLPYTISDTDVSLAASMIYLGVYGSYPAGFLCNIIGRKPCLIIGGLIMISSYIILIFSINIGMIFFGRFMTGFGHSFTIVTSLIYLGEISSSEIRGTLLTLTGVFHNTGALLVNCVGPFTTYRTFNYVPIGIGVVFIVACCFVPESPVYHILKGKHEAAKSCLNYLGRDKDIDVELKRIIFNMQQIESKRILWRQLFCKKSNRKALFLTTVMYFFQMNCGISFFVFFATKIFKNAGSSIDPYVATIIIGVTCLFGSFIEPVCIDRFGRRILLIISTCGCCVCMTVMGVYFYLDAHNHSAIDGLGWLPLLIMIIAFISYGTGLHNVPHTLTSEMYSAKVRGLGSSISTITAWMCGLIFTTVSSYLMVYLGSHITFWLFGAINATAIGFVVLFIPETTGKTLTEIDDMMEN